ncbi:hypothetical protein GCN74_28435, partial [Janthinobacterium sp. FT14W]|uniref:condensation domain-containing protein n=1 Tax=Janthinobacterium sp. FT14W TaxID=2654253 RepID=UPI001264EE2A
LKVVFENHTLGELASGIEQALEQDAYARPVATIAVAERGQMTQLPLSYAQERLWFLDQLEPGGASYNCPGAVTLQGQFDIDLLEAAFRQVI